MMEYDGAEVEHKTQRISSICFGIGSDDIAGEINALDYAEELKEMASEYKTALEAGRCFVHMRAKKVQQQGPEDAEPPDTESAVQASEHPRNWHGLSNHQLRPHRSSTGESPNARPEKELCDYLKTKSKAGVGVKRLEASSSISWRRIG